MAVAGLDALAVVDLDEIAVAAAVPFGAVDDAVGGGVDRGAERAGEIDPGMHGGAAAERIGADAEAAGEVHRIAQREGGRNGGDALLELVELAPAGEQLEEAGIGIVGRGDGLIGAADALLGLVEAARLDAELADRDGAIAIG